MTSPATSPQRVTLRGRGAGLDEPCAGCPGAGGLQALVYEPYRHGAFPGGGRGALDRAAADVSGGEDPRRAVLQEQRRAGLVGESGCGDVAAGEQEPVAVVGELAGQPPGSGLRADEDEQPADGQV